MHRYERMVGARVATWGVSYWRRAFRGRGKHRLETPWSRLTSFVSDGVGGILATLQSVVQPVTSARLYILH